jgi:hypothetical protein
LSQPPQATLLPQLSVSVPQLPDQHGDSATQQVLSFSQVPESQSEPLVHSTQVFEPGSHAGRSPWQSVSLAHATQVFVIG